MEGRPEAVGEYVMRCEAISNLFFDGGLLVSPSSPGEPFSTLDREQIISLFEKHGVLIFRGFDIPPEKVSSITDRFTEAYAPDALRRAARFGQAAVHDVDYGNFGIELHSEASFAASWPEIVWFYCNVPAAEGGFTTLCDGAKLWQGLSQKIQSAVLAQPLRYEIAIQTGENSSQGIEPWPLKTPGISGQIDWGAGTINLAILRYAVHESRRPGSLCFTNHLLVRGESQIKRLTMADGSSIAPDVLSEIEAVSNGLTFELRWQARDLVMIDNVRFMHGRRTYNSSVKRDIVQIQTHRASFAYGATMRRSRSDPRT